MEAGFPDPAVSRDGFAKPSYQFVQLVSARILILQHHLLDLSAPHSQ
jgi:hypothetical protein